MDRAICKIFHYALHAYESVNMMRKLKTRGEQKPNRIEYFTASKQIFLHKERERKLKVNRPQISNNECSLARGNVKLSPITKSNAESSQPGEKQVSEDISEANFNLPPGTKTFATAIDTTRFINESAKLFDKKELDANAENITFIEEKENDNFNLFDENRLLSRQEQKPYDNYVNRCLDENEGHEKHYNMHESQISRNGFSVQGKVILPPIVNSNIKPPLPEDKHINKEICEADNLQMVNNVTTINTKSLINESTLLYNRKEFDTECIDDKEKGKFTFFSKERLLSRQRAKAYHNYFTGHLEKDDDFLPVSEDKLLFRKPFTLSERINRYLDSIESNTALPM